MPWTTNSLTHQLGTFLEIRELSPSAEFTNF